MIFVHPQPFSPANIKWYKDRKTDEVGGVLWTTETYTKVPASSGLIDKKDKIAKVKSYLFKFSSQLSPIKRQTTADMPIVRRHNTPGAQIMHRQDLHCSIHDQCANRR